MTISQNTSPTRLSADKRVEELRQKLGYPVRERDPMGSDFYYLRPGTDADEAAETCPIAVGFYSDEAANEKSLKSLLTSSEWQQRIYGHYTNRTAEQQPVMYILLPTDGSGQVPLVLPTEGGLRQRNIQAFAWGSAELETRLNRLRQDELPVASGVLASVPLVERAFYKPIQTAKELAQLLATAARRIEQVLPNVYQDEKRRYSGSKGEDGYLHKLLRSFQQELLPSLQLVSENQKDYSFSDIYAQTIAYSLFTARVFGYVRDRESGRKEVLFDRQSAWQQLPETNPFLRKLFQDVSERSPEELGDELIGAIADIFAILRAAKMDVILQDFRQKQNREDIVIRFYEDFLAAYKPEMRERRGVYYTPEPVVSYMVRSVDVLLKEKFDKPLGLADPEVMILDPACGTGTFLLWICQLIHDRFHNEREAMIARVGDISWSEYVSEHLLTRIFGFELLMAPYAIAHLKLSLFLKETGYKFNTNKRLELYLQNPLEKKDRENYEQLPIPGMENLIAREAWDGERIRDREPVKLVIGNPPYSYDSENNGEWITSLIRDYYQVDGKALGERNPKGLRDDYVKFFRFAQWKIQNVGQGILAFISNHSYLDNPTFRGMRQSLQKDFDDIYTLDLHGNTTKKEVNPDGSSDKNVFDIQQGVAIGALLKQGRAAASKSVFHADLWGTRESKYKYLSTYDVDSTNWQKVTSQFPNYFLIPQDLSVLSEYEQGWKINEAMPINSVGLYTARDHLAIHWNQNDLQKTLQDFIDLPEESARLKYQLGADSQDWKVSLAQSDIRRSQLNQANFKKISYRPFDTRFIYYTGVSRGLICRPRTEIMRHALYPGNLSLCFIRRSREQNTSNFFVAEGLLDKTILSSADNTNVAPLYLYPETDVERAMGMTRRSNFSQPFLKNITDRLGYTPTPEAIFYYIYAIFHSPTYRSRYAEFLKIDFPRVPLTHNDNLFRQLAIYGEQLVALHLMKSSKLDQPITQFVDQGGNAIVDPAHPKYNNGSVIINKKGDRFINVPEVVWNFHVGGYQVCAKWLKDRKGRTLTQEDILHYQRIIVSLQETMMLMQQIDEAIPEFPIV